MGKLETKDGKWKGQSSDISTQHPVPSPASTL